MQKKKKNPVWAADPSAPLVPKACPKSQGVRSSARGKACKSRGVSRSPANDVALLARRPGWAGRGAGGAA